MTSLGCQDEKVKRCVFNQTNTMCAFAYGNKVKVVDIHTRETIRLFEYIDDVLVFTFNYNDTLIIGSRPYCILLIFDMITRSIHEIRCDTIIVAATCSTYENRVFIGCALGLLYVNADIKPYQLEKINISNVFGVLGIYNLKYNSIRNMLMVRDSISRIRLINATTMTQINSFFSPAFPDSFSNCGNFIVAVEPVNHICIFNLDGHQIRKFTIKKSATYVKKTKPKVSSAVFGKNDTLIIVQYDTGMIEFLNAITGDVVRTIDDRSYVPTNTYNYCNKYVVTCTDQHEIILHNTDISGSHTKPALRHALDDVSSNDLSLCDTLLDDVSLNDLSLCDTSLNDLSLNDKSSCDTSLNDLSLDKSSDSILPYKSTSVNKTHIPSLDLDLNLSELID